MNTFARSLFIIAIFSFITGCTDDSKTKLPGNQALTQSAVHPLLKKYCADCHGPPNPQSHVATEWRNIIYRMQQHRIKRALDKISENEFAELLQYLEQNSK